LALNKFTIVCFEDNPAFIAVVLLMANPLSRPLARQAVLATQREERLKECLGRHLYSMGESLKLNNLKAIKEGASFNVFPYFHSHLYGTWKCNSSCDISVVLTQRSYTLCYS
jgi:hypothetical protein